MPRPKSPQTKRDRRRPRLDMEPVFARRAEVAHVLGFSEGQLRTFEARGIGPAPIRVEGTRLVLHDISAWITWMRRSAASPAA